MSDTRRREPRTPSERDLSWAPGPNFVPSEPCVEHTCRFLAAIDRLELMPAEAACATCVFAPAVHAVLAGQRAAGR